MDPRLRMTDRQLEAWPGAMAELELHGVEATSLGGYGWTVTFQEEVRAGRGHYMDAIFCDGEHFAQVRMDVYGYPSVCVAELNWVHNSSDEECPCEPCKKEREDEDGA